MGIYDNSNFTNPFDRLAEKYDKWYKTPVGVCLDMMEKEAVGEFLRDLEPGGKLLDVGSGTGHWSEFFYEKGFKVTGIDISEPMLRVAREKRSSSIKFIRADANHLPFEKETFDVAVCITVLEFLEYPSSALSEMWRVTRVGGKVIVGTLNRYSILGIVRKLRPAKGVFTRAHFYSYPELKKLLKTYGRTRIIGSAFCPPWEWALPYARLLEEMGRAYFPFLGNFLVGAVKKYR